MQSTTKIQSERIQTSYLKLSVLPGRLSSDDRTVRREVIPGSSELVD